MRRRTSLIALAAVTGLVAGAGSAHAQAPPAGVRVVPSQTRVIVMAGATSPPIALRVTLSDAARATQSYVVNVQLPSELAGHVAAQPATLTIGVPGGQSQGEAPLRFATQPTAPAGSWVVPLASADGRQVSRVTLEIRPGRQAPPGAAPPREEARGNLEIDVEPDRFEVCDGGDAARGVIHVRGVDGYMGTPTLRWERVPAGIFVNAQMMGLDSGFPVPPDRRIPFEVSARGAAAGSHALAVTASDSDRRTPAQSRVQVVVEAADFAVRATPSTLTVRQGGPELSLTLAVQPNDCFRGRSIHLTATGAPSGLEVSVPAGPVPVPTPSLAVGIRATSTAAPGRHTFRLVILDEPAGGRIRHEMRVPVVVVPGDRVEPPDPRERPDPDEMTRTPRVEAVEPSTLAPGERATLELTGRNFAPGMKFDFEPADVRIVTPPIFRGPNRATVEVEVQRDTRTGFRTVVVADSSGRFEGPARLRIEIGQLADGAPEADDEPADPDEPEEPADEPVPPGAVARLDFGGFIVAVTNATDEAHDSFAGQGVLEEFVFAGRLQTVPMNFEFEDLALEATATAGLYEVLSGEAVRDVAVNLKLPAVVAGLRAQIHRMVLRPDEARIDGRVFLPFVESGAPGGFQAGGADGADGGGGPPGGLQVVPPVPHGGLTPYGGGGAVLVYGDTPVTGGGMETLILQALEPAGQDGMGGFQAEPGAPAGRVDFSDQPIGPDGDFILEGLAEIDAYAIGQTGVSFKAQQGLSVLIDLSKGANQNQPAVNSAYRAWVATEDEEPGGFGIGMNFADAGNPPGTPHTSPQWMGLVFLDARLAAGGIGVEEATTDVAWVAGGFQALLAKSLGGNPEQVTAHGWKVDLLNAALGIKNSVLIDAGALGDVQVPFFEEPLRVTLKMINGGTPSMKAIGSVARLFGHTAVIGEGAGFFWHQGELKLGFTDARWAFNGDLEAPQPPEKPGDFQDVLVANQGYETDLEFLKSNYARKFHLKMLTVRSNGVVDLYGTSKRSLGTVPQLDFLEYPFLDGGAHILLEQQGDAYILGLEGNLELAGNLGGVSAATRYTVQNGAEKTWTFEGGIDATVKVVELDLDVAGEVDLVTKDLFFNATGEFTIEQLLTVDAAGAFGRQGSTRYWFVYAALDLQGVPIVETGFVSFYSFKGGVAHNLDVGVSGTCGILEPIAFAQNANQCVDGGVAWTFLAGTVLAPSEAYGGDQTVHVDGTLMISAQGSVDILGQAWMMRSFNEGYGAGATPQAAAHIGVNADRFVMTACVGPSGTSQGAPQSAETISCDGLEPLRYPKAVPVVEIRGWTGFLLDWSTNTYYLAIGHYGNRVEAKYFGLAWRQGYMILAYSPSVPASWLPPLAGGQAGFYAGRAAGYEWGFEHSWGVVCDNKVWANASLGSESNFFLEFAPFALYADVYYAISLSVGAQICGIGGSIKVAGDVAASVYVSQAEGALSGSFSGRVLACGANKCLVLIKIPDVNVNLTLWQA